MSAGNPVVDKEGFRKVIVNLSGLQDTSVVWGLDPQPFLSDQDRAIVRLQIFSVQSEGWDEYRRDLGPPGYPADAYVTTTIGNRTVQVTMRVEAFDKSVEAAEILDGIYTQMQSVDADLQLDAIALAFVDAQPTTSLNFTVDERVVNTAIRDFSFGGIAQRVIKVERTGQVSSSAGDPGTTIDTINAGDGVIPGDFT